MIDFAPSLAPDIKQTILDKLAEIERTEKVRILFAVESGSRAWGFPSPDSDYDARFVYARPVDWYLSLTPGRDVIELPIEDDLDINGWDLRKALGLLLKPNPVLLEWLSSPLRYLWDEAICAELIGFSRKIAHNRACRKHYLGLGKRSFARDLRGKEQVSLKKYFYVLRPALALRWLRRHPEIVPPMNFQELMRDAALPSELTELIRDLLEKKRVTKEMGTAPRIAALENFVLKEFARAKAVQSNPPGEGEAFVMEANALFQDIVKQV